MTTSLIYALISSGCNEFSLLLDINSGAGTVGPFTKEAGFVAYFEICTWLKEGGWKEMKDPAGSPYLVKGDQWIGYDTVPFVLEKMEYVKSRGLGGAMVWAVGLDDIRGVCGPKRPLLTAIRSNRLITCCCDDSLDLVARILGHHLVTSCTEPLAGSHHFNAG